MTLQELLEELEERGFSPQVLIDYLRRELAPQVTVDEECVIDPDTNEPYDYYGWGTYES